MTNITKEQQSFSEGVANLRESLKEATTKSKIMSSLIEPLFGNPEVLPDRNLTLDIFSMIKESKSNLSALEKQLNEVQKFLQNIILLMLQSEKLENFTYNGKLYYPSTTTRYAVDDRSVIEDYILNNGKDALSLLGNTLNSDYLKNLIELASSSEDIEEPVNPEQILKTIGVKTNTTTTINMRNKK